MIRTSFHLASSLVWTDADKGLAVEEACMVVEGLVATERVPDFRFVRQFAFHKGHCDATIADPTLFGTPNAIRESYKCEVLLM
jgi:hypothetical protein